MRFALILVPILASACGAGLRREVVGTATVTAAAPAQVAVAHAGESHELRLRLDLPRAVRVRYDVTCPGTSFDGVVGETFEEYRTRRVAEIQRERERQARAVGALVGSVAGQAAVETPGASVEAEARVDGEAVAEAVVASQPEPQLPPGDVGAQVHKRQHRFVADGAGSCKVALSSGAEEPQDLSGVTVELSLVRVVDVAAERAAAREERRRAALVIRGRIHASLEAERREREAAERARREAEAERARLAAEEERRRREADPAWQEEQRRRAEEARIRREKERARQEEARRAAEERRAKLRAEAEARAALALRVEARRRAIVDEAYRVRGALVAAHVAAGCIPNRRERERERARLEAERRRRELAMRAAVVQRVSLDVRAHLVAELIAGGADPDYRRKQNEAELAAWEARARARQAEAAAREAERRALEEELTRRHEAGLRVRAELKGELVASGAIDRPPRPAPPDEQIPPRPDAASVWVKGSYVWNGVAWEWQPGTWTAPPTSTAVWIPAVEVVIEGTTVLRPGGWVDGQSGTPIERRDHRD